MFCLLQLNGLVQLDDIFTGKKVRGHLHGFVDEHNAFLRSWYPAMIVFNELHYYITVLMSTCGRLFKAVSWVLV